MFFRYAYNKRTEERYTNGITSGPAQDGQLPLERINHTGVADWVRTMGSSLVFNIRAGLNQYLELARSDPGLAFNPAELGFPASLVNQLPNQVFPRINVTDYQRARPQRPQQRDDDGLQPAAELLVDQGHAQPARRPRHAADLVHARDQRQPVRHELRPPLHAARVQLRATRSSGNSIASFLLGAANSGAIDNNFYPTFRWNYYAPWVQDDWKLTDRLTLNLGLRWDLNSPVFEEQDRLNYGFDTQTINPVVGRINQGALLPGSSVRGGLEFVDVDGNAKYPYQFDRNNIQPRVGFAYMLNDRTILRGGYGLYYLNVVGISASNGFGIQTPLITSLDGDRTSTLPLEQPVLAGHRRRRRARRSASRRSSAATSASRTSTS